MECVTLVWYTLFINVSFFSDFKAQKGLHQGDHFSSFLFALSIEYFSRSLKGIEELGSEFHHRCKKVGLVEMMFVDGLLIFCKGTVQLARIIS